MNKKQNEKNKLRLRIGPVALDLETVEGRTVVAVVLAVAVLVYVMIHK